MIKNFKAQPMSRQNKLPIYVNNINKYTLIGTIQGGYKITLARLSVGESVSAGNNLTHALFESYTDHGEQAKITRTRVSGVDRTYIAVRSAMSEAGVEFQPAHMQLQSVSEGLLKALGTWFMSKNQDIIEVSVVSQT